MPHLRPRLAFGLTLVVCAAATVFATTVSGRHGEQRFAGQWDFFHTSGPSTGVTGGFALTHRTDEEGAELLQLIGGLACEEPTDYFTGGYTVPDDEDLMPGQPFNDTGKIRGCTVGDPYHLRGRYESNSFDAVRGDLELALEPDGTVWTGTFTVDGDPNEYTWTGTFDNHFEDGADEPSIPPYDEEPPTEPPPPVGEEPPAGDPVKGTCAGQAATITPDPDNPPGFAISGTASADVILGTPGDDRILGLGGDDTICGLGGDDEIEGGDGADTLHGEDGADVLNGAGGEDWLHGGAGNDRLDGGADRDRLEGRAGNDELAGGGGRDDLSGGGFPELVSGQFVEPAIIGPDDDRLLGGEANDLLRGGPGNDLIRGGAGDDVLEGWVGQDQLYGEHGSDRLFGGLGNDRLDGGEGGEGSKFKGDQAEYWQSSKRITVDLQRGTATGGEGRDVLRGLEALVGSNHDDVLRGSKGPDIIFGQLGDDDIYGREGADRLYGGGHDDLLIGGPGYDRVYGGSPGAEIDICAAEERAGCERVRTG
jgi:Ca2+-binding RTX toxin-like protein